MKSYALRDALEVALEDCLGGQSLSAAYSTKHQYPSYSMRKAERGDGPRWSGDHFDGNPKELDRVVDALAHIPADDRKIWREITIALCDWFLGDARGRDLAAAWAGGGIFEAVALPGCPQKFDRAAQELLWRQSIGCGEFSIATVFHHAKILGHWNTSRARWGLGRVQRPARELPVAARGVQAAGLKMPRRQMNLERFSWLYQVLLATKRPDRLNVAFVIAGFINGGSGIAFPDLETISKALHWDPGPCQIGYQRASRALLGLALDGFLARSPGNARGAHGRIGPSFALTLPGGMTWQEAIDAYRAVFGVKEETVDLASSSIGQCRSEPNSMAATSTGQCQSKPNRTGTDQHQEMRVQTAPHGDQHRAMPVHLSTNLQEGGATVRPGLSGSSPKDVMDTAGDHVPPNTEAKFTATSDAGPVRTIHDPSVSETVSRSDAQATSPDLPAWVADLRAAANIGPYLSTPDGCLPSDVIAKLLEAFAKGMDDSLAEVARKLSALRALGLDDDHIRDLVIATRDYLLEGWAEKRVSKGKLTEDEADCIGLAPMPLGAFVRNLASALAKRVEWAKRDIALGKLIPGSRLDRREPRASSARDRELAALADKPMWGVTGTNATNADLVDLCDEFPTMRPNRVRQLLIDAFATLADSNRDAVALSDVLDDTREAIRRELDQQRAGEAMVGDQAQPHNGSSANDRVDPSPDHQAPLNGCGHHP